MTQIRGELRHAVRIEHPTIIGDVTILQEIIGAAQKRPEKYVSMYDFILQLVGSNWLLPLRERVKKEVMAGRPLQGQERVLPPSIVQQLYTPSPSSSGVLAVVENDFQRKKNFKQEQEAIREKLISRFGRGTLKANTKAWWAEAVLIIDDWVLSYFQQSQDILNLPQNRSKWPHPRSVPSAWHFYAYKLARIWMNLGNERRIEASDDDDARHYAAASYSNTMVTDDDAFRVTYTQITTPPFELEQFDDFVARLKKTLADLTVKI